MINSDLRGILRSISFKKNVPGWPGWPGNDVDPSSDDSLSSGEFGEPIESMEV